MRPKRITDHRQYAQGRVTSNGLLPGPSDDNLNQDVSHMRALADGGDNTPNNIEPLPHDSHVQQHINNGDFARWGAGSGGGS
jgi:hypothetical protein